MSKEIKRHCMVVHAYYPIGEPRVQREAEALIGAGFEVDVICLRQSGEQSRVNVNGVNVNRLPMRRHKEYGVKMQFLEYLGFFFQAFFKLTALYFTRNYDVVQVHNLPDFLVFASIIPHLWGARVILDLHDLMPEFFASRFKDNPKSLSLRLIKWQERVSCRYADRVITVTEIWRQTLIKRGVPPEKCYVVMNLADNNLFAPASNSFARESQNGHFNILYHGTLAHRYGIDFLLRAVEIALREALNIKLTVHGRGDYLEVLRQLSDELKLGDHIKFSDQYLPIEQLPALISDANVGVVPYRRDVFTDGILPTKLMEYAAMGVPAIVARTPVIASYFDETMVEFFPAENVEELAKCIVSLYRDRQRLNELATNIQKFNSNYNWPKQKKGYIALVRELSN